MNKGLFYILGLWCADRGSTAKGVVAIRNKREELLRPLREFGKKKGLRVKERTVNGYSKTKEVYICNSALRELFEKMRKNKIKMLDSRTKILAYFAGLFDGDGTIIKDRAKIRKVRIYYSKHEIKDSLVDAELLKNLGIHTRVWKYRNMSITEIYNRYRFLKMIKPFIKHKEKLKRIKEGLVVPKRARPAPHVGTPLSGEEPLMGDRCR